MKEQSIILSKTSIPSLSLLFSTLLTTEHSKSPHTYMCDAWVLRRERERERKCSIRPLLLLLPAIDRLFVVADCHGERKSMRRLTLRSILSGIVLSVSLLFVVFIVTNWRNDVDDIDLPAVKCNCPVVTETAAKAAPLPVPKTAALPEVQKVETPAVIKTESSTTTTTSLPPFPTCKPVTNESAVQRAIIIYYPSHQSEYFFPEVRW